MKAHYDQYNNRVGGLDLSYPDLTLRVTSINILYSLVRHFFCYFESSHVLAALIHYEHIFWLVYFLFCWCSIILISASQMIVVVFVEMVVYFTDGSMAPLCGDMCVTNSCLFACGALL